MTGAILEVPCRTDSVVGPVVFFFFKFTNFYKHWDSLGTWCHMGLAEVWMPGAPPVNRGDAAIWISDKKSLPPTTKSSCFWLIDIQWPGLLIFLDNLSRLEASAYDKCQNLLVLPEPHFVPMMATEAVISMQNYSLRLKQVKSAVEVLYWHVSWSGPTLRLTFHASHKQTNSHCTQHPAASCSFPHSAIFTFQFYFMPEQLTSLKLEIYLCMYINACIYWKLT